MPFSHLSSVLSDALAARGYPALTPVQAPGRACAQAKALAQAHWKL